LNIFLQCVPELLDSDILRQELTVETRAQLEVDFRLFGSEWGGNHGTRFTTVILSNLVRTLVGKGEVVAWDVHSYFLTKDEEFLTRFIEVSCHNFGSRKIQFKTFFRFQNYVKRVMETGNETVKGKLKLFLTKLAFANVPIFGILEAAKSKLVHSLGANELESVETMCQRKDRLHSIAYQEPKMSKLISK
jgi:hypothetical protein